VGRPPRLRVERRKPATLNVTLLSPEEPVAWAVDARHEAGRGFRVTWHSERTPGARTQPVARSAKIEGVSGARSIAVRVYADDGSLHERAVRLGKEGSEAVEVHP
jgi:hypothetical protein